jgi:hypothetical protein
MSPAGQWVTLSLLVGVAAFLIASDVWLGLHFGPQATYSRYLAHAFDRHPVILAIAIFSVGVLIGHWLLPVYAR